MKYSYHLLSTSGIDVIIIPELDCRINIIDPIKDGISAEKGLLLIYATILNREMAFQVVGRNCPETNDVIAAARWYSQQKTFFGTKH